MKIDILHGTDGKWHLWDAVAGRAMDWPPLNTRAEAEEERRDFYRELGQLREDEASEANGLRMMGALQ